MSTLQKFVAPFPLKSINLMGLAGVLSFIILATVGVLVLSSCASTPAGLQREEAIINSASNSIAYIRPIAQSAPAPIGTAVEGILAAGGAILALWATHVHRSLAELKTNPAPLPADPPKSEKA